MAKEPARETCRGMHRSNGPRVGARYHSPAEAGVGYADDGRRSGHLRPSLFAGVTAGILGRHHGPHSCESPVFSRANGVK